MARPLFSIVIPTRERAETLRYSLQTCLAQDFDDYEIVVCDNCGSPATRDVVDSADSPRIVYVRSDVPLGMSANWELALSRASGTYINILGDDDGMMPYALRELARLIKEHDAPKAITWRCAHFNWPTIAVSSEASYLALPLSRSIKWLDGKIELARAARHEIGAAQLPMIYTSTVHRDLIDRHKTSAGGRMFLNLYPDVYSAYAFAFLCGSYLSISTPMHVAGLSGRSNGVNSLAVSSEVNFSTEFFRLQEEAGYRTHPMVPKIVNYQVSHDDCFLHAKDIFFPDDSELALDRKQMVSRYLGSISSTDVAERAEILAAIRASIADDQDIAAWFDREAQKFAPAEPFRMKPKSLGFDGRYLHLDTSKFGVNTIKDAVDLAASLLAVEPGGLQYDLRDLDDYVADLVECRTTLVDRTRRLEESNELLVDRTRRLEKALVLLADRDRQIENLLR